MAIDLKNAAEKWSGLKIEPLRTWDWCGHEVILARVTGPKPADGSDADTRTHLLCECDINVGEDGTLRASSLQCNAKQVVRSKYMMETAIITNRDAWKRMGLEKAVLDIYARVEKGEYFGQHYPSMIYAQEVAKLLEAPPRAVHEICLALRDKEKLDLNGFVLTDYEPHFRFPEEVRVLFRHMVEEPLGWPNGDAGGCFLAELEGCIGTHSRFKHGKDAFWENNFPNIAPHILVMFGIGWLALAVSRAREGGAGAADLAWTRLDVTAVELERLAGHFRSLSERHVPLVAQIDAQIDGLRRIVRTLDNALKKSGGKALQAAGVAKVAQMLDACSLQTVTLSGDCRPLKRSGTAIGKVAAHLHKASEKQKVQARTVRAATKRLREQILALKTLRRSLSRKPR